MSFLLRYSIYIAIIFFIASCTPRGEILDSPMVMEQSAYAYLFQNDLEYSIAPQNCRKCSKIPELYDILNLKKDFRDSIFLLSFNQNAGVTSFVQCVKSNDSKALSYYLINCGTNSKHSRVLLSHISYAVDETIYLPGCSIYRNGFCHYYTTYDKRSCTYTLWEKDKMSEIHTEFGSNRTHALESIKRSSIPIKTWLSNAKKTVSKDKDKYTVLAKYRIDHDARIVGLK